MNNKIKNPVVGDYDIKKAGNRLLSRFSLEKMFYPNEGDLKALKTVLRWINQEKERNLLNNTLFAKLYIYNLSSFIEDNDSHVFDSIPQKQLSKLLDTPISLFYDSFKNKIKSNQLDRMLESVKNRDGDSFTKQELDDYFNDDFVEKRLNNMITEALNRFK